MPAREYRWRHLALLISILLLFVTAPVVVSLHDGILIMNVISVTVLVAGSYALSERKYLFAIAVVLSAITIAGTGLPSGTATSFRTHRQREPLQFWKRSWGSFISWPWSVCTSCTGPIHARAPDYLAGESPGRA